MSTGEAKKATEMEDSLMSRLDDYRTYFTDTEDKNGKLDHQGTTAYMNLVKLVMGLREARASVVGGEGEMRELSAKILQEVYGIER